MLADIRPGMLLRFGHPVRKHVMSVELHGLQFDLPSEWEDITDELENKWPPTLARTSGVGALQFSIARYESGKLPNITIGDLRWILADFCANLSLEFSEPVEKIGRINSVESVSDGEERLVAVWHISNGRDYAMVTYTSLSPEDPETGDELSQARRIVASIEF